MLPIRSLRHRRNSVTFLLSAFSAWALTNLGGCSFRELKVDTEVPAEVALIFQQSCIQCHSGTSASGGFASLFDLEQMQEDGYVVPGDPEASLLYLKVSENPPYGSRMPKGGPYLDASELELIASWITELGEAEGQDDDTEDDELLAVYPETLSFSTDIVPLLAEPLTDGATTNAHACIDCHNSDSEDSVYNMSLDGIAVDYVSLITNGARDRVIPGNMNDSWLCQKVREHRDESVYIGSRMPKGVSNPVKMTNDQVNRLCHWIQQGALDN